MSSPPRPSDRDAHVAASMLRERLAAALDYLEGDDGVPLVEFAKDEISAAFALIEESEPLAEPERADRGSAVDVAGEPRRTRSVSSGSASGSAARTLPPTMGVTAMAAMLAPPIARPPVMCPICFGKTTIREDGRNLVTAYLFEVKKPSESKGPWDYYKLVATTRGTGRGDGNVMKVASAP